MSRSPRALLFPLRASVLLFGAGLGVGLALAPRSIPVAAPGSPRVAEGNELGTRHFSEGRFWRAADEFVIVWKLDSEHADAKRLTFLATRAERPPAPVVVPDR